MSSRPPVVLTIAGFDPSSGAGVTADIKTIAAHGCYGIACITAMTVQSTRGVSRTEPVSGRLITGTLEELASDIDFRAVHIGMLGSAEAVQAVARFLTKAKPRNVVLDPVLKSSSGALLLEQRGIDLMIERLFPLAAVITPNVDEASALTGIPVFDLDGMQAAAKALHSAGAKAVVVTGGHLERAVDLFSVKRSGRVALQRFQSPRIQSRSTHGTGCALPPLWPATWHWERPCRKPSSSNRPWRASSSGGLARPKCWRDSRRQCFPFSVDSSSCGSETSLCGAVRRMFALDHYAAAFWIETLLVVAPSFSSSASRSGATPAIFSAPRCLMMFAGALYRFNTYLTAYRPGDNVTYFPSAPEILITVGLVAFEILGYLVIVKTFPIFSGTPRRAELTTNKG